MNTTQDPLVHFFTKSAGAWNNYFKDSKKNKETVETIKFGFVSDEGETTESVIPAHLAEVFKFAMARKGKATMVRYVKPCKMKKSAPEDLIIIKDSIFAVRVGINYNNQAAIKEGHESGEIKKAGLPASMEKISNVAYHHKFSGQWYVGVTPVRNNIKRITRWYKNGKEVELKDVQEYLMASEYKNYEKETPYWLTLKAECLEFRTKKVA